uniref:Uncharacterized protein n=1 Tax=Trichuris muris TaxID=70415 RepID=A0A5S6QI93_TRIMR
MTLIQVPAKAMFTRRMHFFLCSQGPPGPTAMGNCGTESDRRRQRNERPQWANRTVLGMKRDGAAPGKTVVYHWQAPIGRKEHLWPRLGTSRRADSFGRSPKQVLPLGSTGLNPLISLSTGQRLAALLNGPFPIPSSDPANGEATISKQNPSSGSSIRHRQTSQRASAEKWDADAKGRDIGQTSGLRRKPIATLFSAEQPAGVPPYT